MEGRCLLILGIIGSELIVLGCEGCRIALGFEPMASLKVLAQQFFLILTRQWGMEQYLAFHISMPSRSANLESSSRLSILSSILSQLSKMESFLSPRESSSLRMLLRLILLFNKLPSLQLECASLLTVSWMATSLSSLKMTKMVLLFRQQECSSLIISFTSCWSKMPSLSFSRTSSICLASCSGLIVQNRGGFVSEFVLLVVADTLKLHRVFYLIYYIFLRRLPEFWALWLSIDSMRYFCLSTDSSCRVADFLFFLLMYFFSQQYQIKLKLLLGYACMLSPRLIYDNYFIINNNFSKLTQFHPFSSVPCPPLLAHPTACLLHPA